MNRVVIFGTGVYYQNRKSSISQKEVVAFIDNDVAKQGEIFDGALVYSPNDINQLDFTYVVLMSIHTETMKIQLMNLGVPESKIIGYTEYLKSKEDDELYIYWSNSKQEFIQDKMIVLLTHELSNTGAPIVLLYMADILKKNGYYPVVFSRKDGELGEKYRNKQISLVIGNSLCGNNFFLCELVKRAQCVICNTLEMGYFVEDVSALNKKVIWWIHEGVQSYREETVKYSNKKYNENVKIYAVSELSKNAFLEHSYEQEIKILPYGIPDRGEDKNKINNKIRFAVIGAICSRKGQDIMIEAIRLLTKEEREKAEFWFVGKISEKSIFDKIEQCKLENVFYKGEIDSSQIQTIYNEIDVVVCPSREDPLPVVLTEGMMNSKICIMSDKCGTAGLIRDGIDGFIFDSEHFEKLASKIREVIQNIDKLNEMKKNSRAVYQNHFGLETFESSLLKIV